MFVYVGALLFFDNCWQWTRAKGPKNSCLSEFIDLLMTNMGNKKAIRHTGFLFQTFLISISQKL